MPKNNQCVLCYKAGLDAAVKVCKAQRNTVARNSPARIEFDPNDAMALKFIAAIAALPVPEGQWRDLTDGELKEVALPLVPDSYDENSDDVALKIFRAVIAKFKEANK